MVKAVQFILLNTDLKAMLNLNIDADDLFYITLAFVIVTVLIAGVTFRISYKKTKQFNFNNDIRERVEQWITELLSNEESAEMTIPADFFELCENKMARQLIIEELLVNKSSFLGSVSDNVVRLYVALGLDADSKIKLEDNRKHIQCQGIHELCVMDQKDQLKRIYRLTNSEDNDVRIEAQTAIIKWYGFFGLRFLDVVLFPITEFQQLKLLELLRHVPFTGLPSLDKWLKSTNDTVIHFALKLTEYYNQQQVYNEVAECLLHEKKAVREQAAKAMAKISGTVEPVGDGYNAESFSARLKYFIKSDKSYRKKPNALLN